MHEYEYGNAAGKSEAKIWALHSRVIGHPYIDRRVCRLYDMGLSDHGGLKYWPMKLHSLWLLLHATNQCKQIISDTTNLKC